MSIQTRTNQIYGGFDQINVVFGLSFGSFSAIKENRTPTKWMEPEATFAEAAAFMYYNFRCT